MQKDNEFVEELTRLAQSVGINLDRDPEQVYLLNMNLF